MYVVTIYQSDTCPQDESMRCPLESWGPFDTHELARNFIRFNLSKFETDRNPHITHVQTVFHGVCLICGAAVLNGEHIDDRSPCNGGKEND